MSEFARVVDPADAELLDDTECVWGYQAGLRNAPEPVASSISRAFRHGWRNGRVDAGHAEPDVAQLYLADAYERAGQHVH